MDAIQKLHEIVLQLRAPNGCPWDREQTFESLTPHIIEEAYELVDAIKSGNKTDIREELGDVLLHVVMLSAMAEETNDFNLDEVADHVGEKMIRRHPHVFGDTQVNSVDEVWENWEKIKATEKEQNPLASIPKSLPALLKAAKIQKKAARMGFDWPDSTGPLEKIDEEMAEIKTALADQSLSPSERQTQLTDELGDMLFTWVNICRKFDIDPETALNSANDKFSGRFLKVLEIAQSEKTELKNANLATLNRWWDSAKSGIIF